MTRAVLALKWRPKTFAEMVGQEHILKPLVHALSNDKLHHAYLFSGTRGVGKTSLARILARCLNCEKGVSAEPCGTCSACSAIIAGSFPGLIEVDAASRTQVTDTRELLETVSYSPMDGRYKVYLVDEVHMLSSHSFNALLKTLEEPPEHVCFLFATTEPEKIPPTIVSRCLQFNLRALGAGMIAEHLRHILKTEDIQADEDAVQLLAEAARGSVRDSLTLTEQAIAHGAGSLQTAEVARMLGTLDKASTVNLLRSIADNKGAELMAEIDRIAALGADPAIILDQLLRLLYEVALVQSVPETEADPTTRELAGQLAREEVQLYYQIALTSSRDLAQAPDPWIGLRMAALRLLSFAPAAHGDRQPPASGKAPSTPPDTKAPAAISEAAPQHPAANAADTPATSTQEQPLTNQKDTAVEQEETGSGSTGQQIASDEKAPPAPAAPPPAPAAQGEPDSLVEKFRAQPLVQELLQTSGGELIVNSIRLLHPPEQQ